MGRLPLMLQKIYGKPKDVIGKELEILADLSDEQLAQKYRA